MGKDKSIYILAMTRKSYGERIKEWTINLYKARQEGLYTPPKVLQHAPTPHVKSLRWLVQQSVIVEDQSCGTRDV